MRLLIRIVAVSLLSAIAITVLLGILASWSPSGWFGIGTATIAALALFSRERGVRRGLGVVACVLLAILLIVRILGGGDGLIRMVTLPPGNSSRWLASIVDEQDMALAGARMLAMKWRLPADEKNRLMPSMLDAYRAMRRDDAFSPSPVLDTLFGRQTADAFDALVIEARAEPEPASSSKIGVIFLHGYAGSYTLECWLVASAARAIGAVTVCPATNFSGHWHGQAGQRTLQTTLDYFHARGIKRIFLAGLSNGAVGASGLARRFASSLEGLILISGAPASGDNAGLPTLVVHGNDDTMASVVSARTFAERTHATLAAFEGGHFVLLVRRSETRDAIAGWLENQWAVGRSKERSR